MQVEEYLKVHQPVIYKTFLSSLENERLSHAYLIETNGYVESYSQEAENGKRRTYYRITENGKKYYQEKCEEWNLTKEVVEKFIIKDEK